MNPKEKELDLIEELEDEQSFGEGGDDGDDNPPDVIIEK